MMYKIDFKNKKKKKKQKKKKKNRACGAGEDKNVKINHQIIKIFEILVLNSIFWNIFCDWKVSMPPKKYLKSRKVLFENPFRRVPSNSKTPFSQENSHSTQRYGQNLELKNEDKNSARKKWRKIVFFLEPITEDRSKYRQKTLPKKFFRARGDLEMAQKHPKKAYNWGVWGARPPEVKVWPLFDT